jgi:hypothetical protein
VTTAFEETLRAALSARDPGPAASALHGRILADRLAAPTRPGALWPRVAWLASAGLSLAVVLALAAVLAQRPVLTGPGASPGSVAPSPSSVTVLRAGDGAVEAAAYPVGPIIGGSLVIIGLLAVAVRTNHRGLRVGAVVAALVVVYVGTFVGTADGIAFRSGMYGVTPGRVGSGDHDGMYVAVTGDQPFTMSLTITNVSRLPLTVRGLLRDDAFVDPSGQTIVPRFVGLGLRVELSDDPATLRPFAPIVLRPDEEVTLAVLGMAGACALPAPGPEGQAGYELSNLNLVYEQLWIERVERVQLPVPVVITTPGTCSGS